MKNILIPTDFSKNAWNATKYAIELFRNEQCKFHLLNTYTPAIAHSRFMATTVHGGLLEDSIQSVSENGLEKLLEKIKNKYSLPGDQFNTISSFNLLTEEIRETVEEENIDLIVTGTKGASGLEEIFMGSNTVRIIKSIKTCPVLTIPNDFTYVNPTEIAFATDFKRNFGAEVIDPLIQIAKNFKSSIRILHINEAEQLDKYQQSNKDILVEYLSSLGHTLHWMPYFSSKSDVIQHFIEEFEFSMLAMVNYRHGFLEELIREPVIKRVAFHTKIPLLVLPE